MCPATQGNIAALFLVIASEIFIHLRVPDGSCRIIFQQVLLGNIGGIFRLFILGEQMIKWLVFARPCFRRNGIVPFVRVVELGVNVKNNAAEFKQAVFDDLSQSEFGRTHAVHAPSLPSLLKQGKRLCKMLEILNIALPFFGLILLGVVAGRIWKNGEEGLAWLNIYVLYFALPPLIFMIVAQTPLEKLANPMFVVATAGATTTCFLLMVFTARYFYGAALREATLMGTAAAYGNIGYMGLPLSVAFFGQSAGVPAALVFCFDIIVLFVLTAVFAGLEDGTQKKMQVLGKILWDVCTHPFNIATLLGALATAVKWQPSGALLTIVDMLMHSAAPVALFAMGVTVSLRGKPVLNRELATLGVIKIILHPALALAAVYLFVSADSTWLQVAVMMAALPTATNAFILARQYNAYVAGAGASVITTTAVSVITIPLIVYALKHAF